MSKKKQTPVAGFKPGKSGNPKGLPVGAFNRRVLREYRGTVVEDTFAKFVDMGFTQFKRYTEEVANYNKWQDRQALSAGERKLLEAADAEMGIKPPTKPHKDFKEPTVLEMMAIHHVNNSMGRNYIESLRMVINLYAPKVKESERNRSFLREIEEWIDKYNNTATDTTIEINYNLLTAFMLDNPEFTDNEFFVKLADTLAKIEMSKMNSVDIKIFDRYIDIVHETIRELFAHDPERLEAAQQVMDNKLQPLMDHLNGMGALEPREEKDVSEPPKKAPAKKRVTKKKGAKK